MARRNNPELPNDPSRIDISLDLVGESSRSALDSLVEQLSTLNTHLASVSTAGMTPEAQVAGQRAVAGRMHAGIQHGAHAYQSRGDNVPAAAQDAHGAAASRPDEGMDALLLQDTHRSLYRRMLDAARRSESPTGFIDQEIALYGAREREQAARRGYGGRGRAHNPSLRTPSPYDNTRAGRGGYDDSVDNSAGGASEGASIPVQHPEWMRSLQADPDRYERGMEPFQLPQFGEFTIQDKLNMASNFFQQQAVRRYDRRYDQAIGHERNLAHEQAMTEGMSNGFSREEMERIIANDPQGLNAMVDTGAAARAAAGSGLQSGRTAMVMRMAADQSAMAVTATRDLRRMMGYGRAFAGQGTQAGYERGSTWGPIIDPTTIFQSGSATQEAARQRFNVQRLRLRGGINQDQAQEIVGTLSALGWTGAEGQNLAFNGVAPLVQQGQNPAIVGQMLDQSLRNGTGSVREFVQAMDDLGPAAQASRMSLDEYAEALDGFANQMQEMGGTYQHGLTTGRALSSGFGMSPQQAGQLVQSPLVASMAMMGYGALPQEVGALGPTAMANNISGAIDLAMRVASPFRDQPIRNRETGKIEVTGAQRQKIMAAHNLGVSPDTFNRALESQRQGPGIVRAEEVLNQYDSAGKNLKKLEDAKPHRTYAAGYGAGGPEKEVPGTEEYRKAVDAQWTETERALRDAAPKTGRARADYMKQIDRLRQEDDPRKRASSARQILEKQARGLVDPDKDNVAHVEFTGAAAKYFQQVEKKLPEEFRNADAGGPARNTADAGGTDYLSLLRAQIGGGTP
jgi:hypothetical protein